MRNIAVKTVLLKEDGVFLAQPFLFHSRSAVIAAGRAVRTYYAMAGDAHIAVFVEDITHGAIGARTACAARYFFISKRVTARDVADDAEHF